MRVWSPTYMHTLVKSLLMLLSKNFDNRNVRFLVSVSSGDWQLTQINLSRKGFVSWKLFQKSEAEQI